MHTQLHTNEVAGEEIGKAVTFVIVGPTSMVVSPTGSLSDRQQGLLTIYREELTTIAKGPTILGVLYPDVITITVSLHEIR